MRRTASEIVRNLEMRVARLEKQAKKDAKVKINQRAIKSLSQAIMGQWDRLYLNSLLDNVQLRDAGNVKDIHIDPEVDCLFMLNHLGRIPDHVNITFSGEVFYIDEEGFEDNQSFEGLMSVDTIHFYKNIDEYEENVSSYIDEKYVYSTRTVSKAIISGRKDRSTIDLDEK